EDLRERLELAIAQKDLPSDTDAAALSRYLCTVINGIAIQASSGATEAQLVEVANMALASFPKGE
ncbi:MAG: TetR/AcrR family transcriptional regulator, partial [Paraglaciecola chathamensis]